MITTENVAVCSNKYEIDQHALAHNEHLGTLQISLPADSGSLWTPVLAATVSGSY